MSAPVARTIHERMADILSDLPAIGKVQKNEQQNFMFRGHDDVMNALNPLLAKHRVFVVPSVIDRVTAQRQTARGSIMFEVNLLVGYRFYGPAGDYVEASAWGEGTDVGDKATNKAMTMAFKNVLNQSFAINTAETIDADSLTPEESVRPANGQPAPQPRPQASDPTPTPPSPPAPDGANLASDKQKTMIRALAKKLGLDVGSLDYVSKQAASAKITELQSLETMRADAVGVGGGMVDDIPFARTFA